MLIKEQIYFALVPYSLAALWIECVRIFWIVCIELHFVRSSWTLMELCLNKIVLE